MIMIDMKTLSRTVEIDAPPHEVWRVLTDLELVREWAAAYGEGLSIRTTWREGGAVAWRATDGATRASGKIAAFDRARLLRLEYTESALGDGGGYADTYELQEIPTGARLAFTSGPFEDAQANAIEVQAAAALAEIKSLAEESAQIHGLRSPKAAGAANG